MEKFIVNKYMKLLYISPSEIPSSSANSIHVVNMCESLSKLGISVSLYSYHTSGLPKSKETVGNWYGIKVPFSINSTKWYKIKGYGLIYALIVFFKSLRERISGKSLVYTRCIYTAFLNNLIGAPFIYENHSPPRTMIHELIEKSILQSHKCLCFVVVTSSLKKYYVNKYIGKLFLKKILVAPDAVRIENVVAKAPKPKNWSKRLRIVYTGGLMPGKGAEQVVEIARLMPEHDFVVVGGTKEQVASFSHERPFNLHIAGQLRPSETREYQLEADILLLPNQLSVLVDNGRVDIGKWTSPLKLFEYMSTGNPIIASDIEVLKEILCDQENCLLVSPSDTGEWCSVINKLISNVYLREKISRNAFGYVFKNFTWEKRAENILNTVGIIVKK